MEQINEKTVKRVMEDFRRFGELTQAQQTFIRLAWWVQQTMPEKEARDFMLQVIDPDPIQDWETGAELGDLCPVHEKVLDCFSPSSDGKVHLECHECLV